MKKTAVFDFDGVIHSYTSGWKGRTIIPDEPVPGIEKALKEVHEAGYEVVVVSTRCSENDGVYAIVDYLERHDMMQYVDKVLKEKPPALVYVDDRAICFDGDTDGLLDKIVNFQPWYKKERVEQVNHPAHYNAPGRKECIEEMVDKWGTEFTAVWCEMTAYKYEYRAGMKESNSKEQDMAKRKWYLDKAKELRCKPQMKAPVAAELAMGVAMPMSVEIKAPGFNDALKQAFEKGVEKELRVGLGF